MDSDSMASDGAGKLYTYPYYYRSSIDLVDLIPLQAVGLV